MADFARLKIPLDARLRDFMYHQVSADTAGKMTFLREQYYNLAAFLCSTLPDTREHQIALMHLEESCMRAIQCLAVTEGMPTMIGKTSVP